jgi:ribosomal-protein-alanine N-acetyltransferase
LAIDPGCQGNGIGTAVLEKAIERGREKGKPVFINVMKTNIRAKYLYEKLGFLIYEENDIQFLLKLDFLSDE